MEFWFDLASNYSYLSAMRIEALTSGYGVSVKWRPFLLGPIFSSLGWTNSPFVLQQSKGKYVWKDMARQSAKYGVRWQQPTEFPRNSTAAARVAALGLDQPWCAVYCRAMFEANFADNLNISDKGIIVNALKRYVSDPEEIYAQANSLAHKSRLRLLTEEAMSKEIFGAPTFVVNGELFWGNDRLEDAILSASTNG